MPTRRCAPRRRGQRQQASCGTGRCPRTCMTASAATTAGTTARPAPATSAPGLSARARMPLAHAGLSLPLTALGRTAGPHLRHRRRSSSEARPDLYNAYRESMARLAATCPPDRSRDHFGAATSARPPPQASQSPAPSLHAQPRRRLSQAPSLRRTARSITRSPGRRPLQATRSHWRSALPALTEMRPSRWRARTCALRPATARRMRRRSRTTGCPSSARHIPTPPHPTPPHPPLPPPPPLRPAPSPPSCPQRTHASGKECRLSGWCQSSLARAQVRLLFNGPNGLREVVSSRVVPTHPPGRPCSLGPGVQRCLPQHVGA